MSERKVEYLNKEIDKIDELINEFSSLKKHVKGMAIVAILDRSNGELHNRVAWYISEENTAELLGLMDMLKLKIMQL